MPRLSPTDKMTALRKRQEQIANELKMLQAREREQSRKLDARRKIIAGALALEHFEKNPNDAFSRQLLRLLDEYVPARNRPLFPFLPEKAAGAAEDPVPAEPKRS